MVNQKKFESHQTEILNEIKESYRQNKLIPFVGAGFSTNIEGYPGWETFLANLSKDIRINLLDLFKNPNEAAEFYIWYKANKKLSSRRKIYYSGKRGLVQKIVAELNNQTLLVYNKDEWKQHEILVEKFSRIYTTNWDIALEKTIEALKYKGTKFFSDDRDMESESIGNVKGRNTRKVEIIKFHGDCINNKDETIREVSVTASEYDLLERIEKTYPIDHIFIEDCISGKDFLFIGYSFSDPNFQWILFHVSHLLDFVGLTGDSDRNKNRLFWFVLDVEYNHQKIEFLKKWKRIYPYYLFSKENECKSFKKKIEQLTSHTKAQVEGIIRNQANKNNKDKIKECKKNILNYIKPCIIQRLGEITNS